MYQPVSKAAHNLDKLISAEDSLGSDVEREDFVQPQTSAFTSVYMRRGRPGESSRYLRPRHGLH